MRYPNVSLVLPEILAQIVHFSRDEFQSSYDHASEDWNVAYVCACFLAQHTMHGEEGVDTEGPLVSLKIGKRMTFDKRLKLAQKLVKEWDIQ